MNDHEQYLYSIFPESIFPTICDLKEYNARLLRGLKVASESNIVITGLGRNISDTLDHTMARLYKTASFFNDCKFVLYENDSTDGTSQALKKYDKSNRDIILIQETLGHKQFGKTRELARPKYLGGLRNKCQDTIKQLHSLLPIDYIIVIDLDLEGGWSYDGILNSLSYDNWSAMTANGIEFKEVHILNEDTGETSIEYCKFFFDTWAYKEYGSEAVMHSDTVNEYIFHRGENPVEVFSNFNGLGVYKYEDVIECMFDAEENPDGTVINEWSYYHREIRKGGGSIFLNPSMIALYSPHEFSFKI